MNSQYSEAVESLVNEICSAPEVSEALSRIRRTSADSFTYHNINHVLDVMNEVALFCIYDKVPDRQTRVVLVAAAFHDTGIFYSCEFGDSSEPPGLTKHEERSIENLQAALSNSNLFGFTDEEIDEMAAMIRDTKLLADDTGAVMFSEPSSPLAAYLVDADLSNFGRGDFLKQMEAVRTEVGVSKDIFKKRTLAMLTDFEYRTAAARALREQGLEQNRIRLRNQINMGLF